MAGIAKKTGKNALLSLWSNYQDSKTFLRDGKKRDTLYLIPGFENETMGVKFYHVITINTNI